VNWTKKEEQIALKSVKIRWFWAEAAQNSHALKFVFSGQRKTIVAQRFPRGFTRTRHPASMHLKAMPLPVLKLICSICAHD
jgi:hypothetical protein